MLIMIDRFQGQARLLMYSSQPRAGCDGGTADRQAGSSMVPRARPVPYACSNSQLVTELFIASLHPVAPGLLDVVPGDLDPPRGGREPS